MKILLFAFFGLPIVSFAQVGVGDLNLNCSGYNMGSFNLTKSGRHAAFNGTAMSIGREGLYRTPDGHSIWIRVYSDGSSGVTFYPASAPGNDNLVSGRAVCSGRALSYRLRYDRHGFPVSVIVPSDRQSSGRYRCDAENVNHDCSQAH